MQSIRAKLLISLTLLFGGLLVVAAAGWYASATTDAMARSALVASIVAGACAFCFAIWSTSAHIIGPLEAINGAMQRLARGEGGVTAPGIDRQDELGSMARALQVFKQNSDELERLRAEQGELATRSAAQRAADMRKLADGFEAAIGGIVDAVSSSAGQLETAATTLTRTAETTQQLSALVASGSEQASSNVQSVASASDELTASVHEIARQVHESSRIASEAVSQAGKTDTRIAELSRAASRIGDVVKLITAIAEQTNLLALNATIEAARAGEAGKGFAVVASEVKTLANQTAKATDEIGAQISGMQAATRESVAAIKEISATINRISEIASAIAAAVEQQGAATQEIARNVQQAAAGTTQVASNIADVNRGASETGAASAQVLSSATSLSREGNRLKAEVGRFVSTLRAG